MRELRALYLSHYQAVSAPLSVEERLSVAKDRSGPGKPLTHAVVLFTWFKI
jgi:hypothetical protein